MRPDRGLKLAMMASSKMTANPSFYLMRPDRGLKPDERLCSHDWSDWFYLMRPDRGLKPFILHQVSRRKNVVLFNAPRQGTETVVGIVTLIDSIGLFYLMRPDRGLKLVHRKTFSGRQSSFI